MENVPLRTDHFSIVIDLSSRELSDCELNVLSRGLSFCPVPGEVDDLQLKLNLDAFFHRLRLQEFFSTLDKVASLPSDSLFKNSSNWDPPKNRDNFLESYISVVEEEVLQEERKTFHNN